MKRILFYSDKLNSYLKYHTWNDTLIINYFDIESQKHLKSLGFSYKNYPILLNDARLPTDISIDKFYNLDILSEANPKVINKHLTGVIFNCYC